MSWRPYFAAGALAFLCLGGCSGPEPPSITVKARFMPVNLGFCPRYLIEDRHAWMVGKLAPGKEKARIAEVEFTLRGYFLTDEAGAERVRTSCDKRPYPIFHLLEVVSERLVEPGEPEPKVTRGPGAYVPPPEPTPEPKVKEEIVPAAAAVKKVKKRKRKRKRRRRLRRRVRAPKR